MLPISLDCPFLIAPLAFSNIYSVQKSFDIYTHGQRLSKEGHVRFRTLPLVLFCSYGHVFRQLGAGALVFSGHFHSFSPCAVLEISD